MSHDPSAAPAALADAISALRAQAAGQRAQAEAAATTAQRSAALAELAGTRDQIRSALATITPGQLVAGLDARVPLALLPVRLETRFADPGSDVLHVRIFPDDAHVDGHDPELTAAEAALGAALWAAPADLLAAGEGPPAPAPPADLADGRRAQWASLVRLLGGPRAAWVARATRPGATPTVKPAAYVRPPTARALPDRWLVRAYAGAAVADAWTSPVGVDLHLAPDPQSVPGASADPSLPPVDSELRWLVDYAAAVAAGMAVDVPLPPGTTTVDRVVAVGVRASTSPTDAAAELGALLDAHRYTDGLGFLPTGSPTSNTPAQRSAHDRAADPGELWAAEFGSAASSAGTAALALTSALGLPAGALDGLRGSGDAGDAHARAMQAATWAATWGTYLGEFIDTAALGAATADSIRSHYLSFVRGRGILPVLRLGRQPYGVLPVLRLGTWEPDGESATVAGLAALLQRVRPLWQYGVAPPLTARAGPAFDAAFTAVMSTDAVARGYAVRSALADQTFDSAVFTGIDTTTATTVIDTLIGNLLGTDGNPLSIALFSPTAQPVRVPLVADPRDPAPDATVQAAIRGLTGTGPGRLLSGAVWITPSAGGPATLLHTLLRRSLLLDYGTTGINLAAAVAAPGTATLKPGPASLLQGLSPDPAGGFAPAQSVPRVLTTPVAAVTGQLAAGDWLWQNPTQHPDVRRHLDETLAAFGVLATLSAAELELLLRETLDLATHRWTAWAESVAADKLARLRQSTPAGIALGGWGIAERVTRRARTSVDPGLSAGAATGPLWADTRSGGFVHAPSTAQAATAAVLRAAHLAHGGDDDPAFALDLSSAAARTALRLADGIRAGQELGALLGYELERDLRQRGPDAMTLIAPLRAFAPRWKASGTFVEGDAEMIVSPSAVVDGLAVADAVPAEVAQAVLPAGASDALKAALAGALETLGSHRHALADLLTAEAIHQTLHGNSSRAAAALDAASRGGVPPAEFEVLRTPRNGAAHTSRLAVLLSPPPPGPLAGDWPASPRGTADPDLAAWLAGLLPPVARVRLRVTGASGAVTDARLPAAAAIGPLDVVLDQPPAVRARIQLALAPGTTLASGRGPAWTPDTVGLDELLTVAAGLREVVAARALRAADLASVGPADGAPDERDAADLRTRLSAARARLQATATAVTAALAALAAATPPPPAALATARAALSSVLAAGIFADVPDPAVASDLASALGSASAELARRLAIPAPAADAPADDVVEAMRALLGPHQPALPRIVLGVADSTSLTSGLAAGDAFLATAPDLAADWLDDLAGVRRGAGLLAAALQDCDALTAGRGLTGGLRIIEPGPPGHAWSATQAAADLAARSPAATIVAWCPGAVQPSAGSRVCGLVVDEWVEAVPEPAASTSVAYEAEAPTGRAPQVVLLGLAPQVASGWTADAVVDLALEAAELAGLRTVDLENAAWAGRLLPAVLLPDGDAKDVIAAPPPPLLSVDAAILATQRAQAKELG